MSRDHQLPLLPPPTDDIRHHDLVGHRDGQIVRRISCTTRDLAANKAKAPDLEWVEYDPADFTEHGGKPTFDRHRVEAGKIVSCETPPPPEPTQLDLYYRKWTVENQLRAWADARLGHPELMDQFLKDHQSVREQLPKVQ